MFRSRAVAYMKPSSSFKTVLILVMGNSFLTICLFISLKLLTTHTVLSFFGMIKVGEAHSESACHFKTPKLRSLWISMFKVSTCFLVLGMVCHDMVVLPFQWSEIGLQSQSPSVPSNSSSNCCRRFSNLFFSVALR